MLHAHPAIVTPQLWNSLSLAEIMTIFLARLPPSLGRSILFVWLRAKSLSNLDVAICNRGSRGSFLELLHNAAVADIDAANESDWHRRTNACRLRWMKWLIERKVKCATFRYGSYSEAFHHPAPPSPTDLALMKEYVHVMADQLTDVLICSSATDVTELMHLVAENNCQLKFLSVNATNSKGEEFSWVSLIGSVLTQSAGTLTRLALFSSQDRKLQLDSELIFPALRQLKIKITCDEDLISLCSAARQLQHIHLQHTRCTHVAFEAIGRYCRDLSSFQVQSSVNGFVDNIDAGFSAIAAGCRKLQRLYLDACTNLSDVGMLAVAAQCRQLQELTLMCSCHITDASLIALAQSAGACLRYVSLQFSRGITGVGIGALGKCSSLRTVQVICCEPTSSADLVAAIAQLHSVTYFKCDHLCVDDAVLRAIAEHMPHLERLNLDVSTIEVGTRVAYTSTGLLQIALKCEKLKIMEVSADGPILTDMERGLWKHIRPALQILPEKQYVRAVVHYVSDDE